MPIEIFNRYENKYLTDRKTYEKLLGVMDAHMVIDKYNKNYEPYTIANIYYDTWDDYLIRNSLSKPPYKEKLRLRSYGVPGENSDVFLEIKKKFGGIVNKRRTALKLKEAYRFVSSGTPPEIKPYMNAQVVREIEYFLSYYSVEPKVYIAYDRVAYFARDNADLRISFDTNIRSRREHVALDAGDWGGGLLGADSVLMEIKTSRAMPLWLVHTLCGLGLRRTGFSKYGTEYRRHIMPQDLENVI